MAKTAVELMAERVARLEKKVKNLSSQPRLANASIEDTSVPIRDQGGLTRASLGRQSDGSHGSHVVVSPAQPTPDAPDLSVGKAGVVAVRWDGDADGPAPLVHGHVEVQAQGPSDADWQVVGTIRDRDGGATTFAADESGTTRVRLVMVGQDRVTRSEASDVSEVEVELPASTSEVQAAIESADGKNVITYDPAGPQADGQGVGDVHFQVDDVTGVVQQAWRWDGTAWVEQSFGDEVLDSISAGKIAAGTIEAAVGIGSSGYIRSTDGDGLMSEMVGAGFRTEAPDGTIIFDSRGGEGNDSTAFGVGADSPGAGSSAIGDRAISGGTSSTALGFLSDASGDVSIALGAESAASAYGSSALGFNSWADGEASTALGAASVASGTNSTAIGVQAEATAIEASAFGRSASATGDASLAAGFGASAGGHESTAVGWEAGSLGDNSTALGKSANATHLSATALGYQAEASGNYATALGYQSTAGEDMSLALGPGANAAAYASVAIGRSADALNPNEGVLGGTGPAATNHWRVPGDFAIEGVASGDGLIREIASPVVDDYGNSVSSATAYIILGKIAVVNLFLSSADIPQGGSQTTSLVRLHADLGSSSNTAGWAGLAGGSAGSVTGLVRTDGDVDIRWAGGTSTGYLSATLTYPVA